jgi:hypothetical protein
MSVQQTTPLPNWKSFYGIMKSGLDIFVGIVNVVSVFVAMIFLFPLFFMVVIGITIYLLATISNYTYESCTVSWMWIKSNVFTITTSAAFGAILGMCLGWQGFFIGGMVGILFGVILKFVINDNIFFDGTSFGLQPVSNRSSYQTYTEGTNRSSYSKPYVRPVVMVERPWTWKGFQTAIGPKEDTYRLDV